MHDFFVDRVVCPTSLNSLVTWMGARNKPEMGLTQKVLQRDVGGGNAVNLAFALASLGLKTLLITHSDATHRRMLLQPFENLDVEVRVKSLPPALTLAFEGGVNVMLNDGRGAAKFSPSLLDEQDWDSLKNSGLICSVNWAVNTYGTELLLALRRRLGEKTIFLDPADFRDRQIPFSRLLKRIKERNTVDWLSLNEEEAFASAKLLRLTARDAKDACRRLAEALGIMVDVHSKKGSFSSSRGHVYQSVCRESRVVRSMGAGDVWNAATIYGRLTGMPDTKRLEFANAAARLYISTESLKAPSLAQVMAATK